MADQVLSHTVPSEEQIEAFLRGEDSLDFRSTFGIDTASARYITRQVDEGEEKKEFLAIKGVATTAEVDDNGVEVVPDALSSLPDDFSDRTTVLFNHDMDMPIGRLVAGESTKFVSGRAARVEVDPVLIDVDVRLPKTGQRIVDAIERGTLDKFSFSWSTRDGIVVFGKEFFSSATGDELEDMGLDPEDVEFSFRIGLDNAPFVRVFSLRGVELSIVSVPADAGAGFGMASFSRNLEAALMRYKRNANGQIFIPEHYRQVDSDEVIIPIREGRISSEPLDTEKLDTASKQEAEMSDSNLREVIADVVREVIDSEDLNTEKLVSVEFKRCEKTTTRPFDIRAAHQRVLDWANGSVENSIDQAYAFVGFRRMTRQLTRTGLLHHDVIDGELVASWPALSRATNEFENRIDDFEDCREQIREHLYREYTETFGVDPDEVPDILKASENAEDPEEVTKERE